MSEQSKPVPLVAAAKPCPASPLGRNVCERTLLDGMAGKGVEVTVTTAAPLINGPFTTDGWGCPHGVTYWMEPTSEQIASWAETRTP